VTADDVIECLWQLAVPWVDAIHEPEQVHLFLAVVTLPSEDLGRQRPRELDLEDRRLAILPPYEYVRIATVFFL
jgi:hypothetical protein